ncbi:MAG: hypothetical protein NTY64_23795 [Deltaproteobacteria bacterium]|nr:hypothetical protein [Deltaproteobacteria bacterium]
MRFTFVATAYHPSTPHSGGFARRVPRNAGELFTKPSLWRLFTKPSRLLPHFGKRSDPPPGSRDRVRRILCISKTRY